MINSMRKQTKTLHHHGNFWLRLGRDLITNRYVYLLALPGIAYYLVYHFYPMSGVVLAFKSYRLSLGVWNSPWVGLANFKGFLSSFYFVRILRNTLLISVYTILFGFPVPILFALLLNEVRQLNFKKLVQSVTYMPHFISMVVICGMINSVVAPNGLVNNIRGFFGGQQINYLALPEWFRTVYVISDIWQGFGWGSIIYIAALTNIDPQLYEAAMLDGAGRLRQTIHVSIPGILPTVIIMLILRVGNLMNVGYEKVFLLYNNATMETADVISTFVYRKGILQADFSYSTAVGLFNSVINLMLVVLVNAFSKRLTETSLW